MYTVHKGPSRQREEGREREQGVEGELEGETANINESERGGKARQAN